MKKNVILVHGYFKTEKDMYVLKSNLENYSFKVHTIDLPLTFKTTKNTMPIFQREFNQIADNLAAGEKIDLVGHSTGGILIRQFLILTEYPEKIGRVVLIAAPNRGSKLATMTKKYFKPFINIFKTLKSIEIENLNNLSLADGSNFEIAAIAGNNNSLLLAKLLNKANDGRIRVESVKFSGLKDFIILPYGHKDIHYQEQTARLVVNFLNSGNFSEGDRNKDIDILPARSLTLTNEDS
jgi:pimeloyl-ACP methyl ester carboxylesterase